MPAATRPRVLQGFVSQTCRPELVRAADGVIELRFVLGVKRWANGRTYAGTDYHHIALRDPSGNAAISYANVLRPGMRLHLHGTWRTRDGTPELVVTRLYQPLPIPEGTPTAKPQETQ